MSDATCPRCGIGTQGGFCGRCLARVEQPPGDPPKPPVPGMPRVAIATERAVRGVEREAEQGVGGETCRSCHAPIRWVRTRAGKSMPLDVTPTGNVVLGEDGTARVLTRKQVEQGGIVGPRYVSHYATCPQAKQWRRE